MARRPSGSFRGRSPRRLTEWSEGPGDQSDSGFVASGLVILGAGVAAVTKITVTRIFGELVFRLRSSAAAGNGYIFTWGLGIVTADAFAIGATAMPNPQDDMDWGGWLMHGFTTILDPSGTLSDIGSAVVVRIPIDVKAQRIMSPNDVLFMIVDALEVGTAVAGVSFDSRALFKLH